MRKLIYLFTAILFLASASLIPLKSQSRESETLAGPEIVDTWDAELGFCHGKPLDCYEMIIVKPCD